MMLCLGRCPQNRVQLAASSIVGDTCASLSSRQDVGCRRVINEKACVVTVAGPGPPPLPVRHSHLSILNQPKWILHGDVPVRI